MKCSYVPDHVNSFDNPLVKGTVEKIVKQGPAYYRAIHQSTETAQNGCSFARDAIDFCQRLLRAEDSVDTLKSGLEDIKQVAKIAHQGSTEMNKLFKLVRTELFQVRIPCHHDNYLINLVNARFRKMSLQK